MAAPSVQPLSEYEQFLANQFTTSIMDVGMVLEFLRLELPREEFLRIARPVLEAGLTLAAEAMRLQLRDPDARKTVRWFGESLEIPAILFDR